MPERSRGKGRGRGRGRGSRCQRSDNSQEENSSTIDEGLVSVAAMIAKSGKQWTATPPVIHRRAPQDIIRNPPGARREGIVETELEAFQLFLTPDFLDIILRETNREAAREHGVWNNEHPNNQKKMGESDL